METLTDIQIDLKEVGDRKQEAQKMLHEGNYLQSLEQFSKILVDHPFDQEALEGRLSACLKLTLFHRCLNDIETLSQINPMDSKAHNLAGHIYEQIGAFERSICAYLKAYLYEQETEIRLEKLQKICRLCSTFWPELHAQITDFTDGFQMLLLLSKKIVVQEKFQVCLDMLVTAIMAHCLDETALKAFKNGLNVCSKRDNVKNENISKTLQGIDNDDTNIEVAFERITDHKNTEAESRRQTLSYVTISKSDSEVINSLERNCRLDTLPEISNAAKNNSKVDKKTTPNFKTNSSSCNTKIDAHLEKSKMLKDELNETSFILQGFHQSIAQLSSGEENMENTVPDSHVELADSSIKEITFLEETDATIINEILSQACECCYQIGRVETSLWFAKIMLKNSKASKNVITILKAYTQLGFLYSEYGKHETSVLYYTKVRAQCREILEAKDTFERQVEVSVIERETIFKLCLLYKDLELYEEAEVFIKEFFSKVEVVEQDGLVKAYDILGEVEISQGRYQDAMKSHKTQMALCLKYHDQKGMVLAYGKLGEAYQAAGDNVAAMEWFQMALRTANAINDPFSLATAYSHIGKGLLFQSNPQKALPYFEKQLDLTTAIDQKPLRCQALCSLGVTYQELRLFQHAEFFLKRALFESQDLKLHLEGKIKESLVQVLLTLRKSSEALRLLFEIRETLESKFQRLNGHRIVASHPVLDKLNTCVDQILELLAEEGRHDEALELAERTSSIPLNQMMAYRACVQGSETAKSMNLSEIRQVCSHSNKIVLYYRVVKNGFMVWVLGDTLGIVHFHWFKAPPGLSFEGMIEELMNGLLTPEDTLVGYTCDHRKVSKDPQAPVRSQDTLHKGLNSSEAKDYRKVTKDPDATTRSQDTLQGPTSNAAKDNRKVSKDPQVTARSKDILQGSTSSQAKDYLQDLSKLFIFPIEEALKSMDMSSHDVVIINNSFLSMVPFAHLNTSTGNTLEDIARSVQLLPCISVLEILEKDNGDSPKAIRVIGNPDVKSPEMLSGFQSHVQPDFLEEELNDVAVVLGTRPDLGACATKEYLLRVFSSTSLLHLSTYGSHDHGTITLAPIPDNDPRGVASDSWEVTLEDIVACRRAPEVVVLSSCYGCRNRFKELAAFNASLPLALMIAGAKTVVMATWSTPQKALLTCLHQFYKNLSDGLTVACSLSRAKTHVEAEFKEPFYWASFSIYGRDSLVNVEELRGAVAEASFENAQQMAVERFKLVPHSEESCDRLLAQSLMETVVDLIHRHHLHPNLLPILLQVTQEAITILQTPSNTAKSVSLPYREITPSWLSLIFSAEKFLLSVGFVIKNTSSKQTILVYPHWNQNGCLEKVLTLLQCVLNIVTYSAVLADALRSVLSQEEKNTIVSFRDLLQKRLASPYEVVEISSAGSPRMFWLKRSTQRLMIQLGFRQVGDLLEFRNGKEDRNAVESCLKISTLLTAFETVNEIQAHPMLSKANLGESWMSRKVGDEENTARKLVAQSLDSINTRYKLAMNDVRKWHTGVLVTQGKVSQKAKLDKQKSERAGPEQTNEETSKPPQNASTKREPLDLIKLGDKFTKIKVHGGGCPSCVRIPVEKEQPVPLVECMVRRHDAITTLYQCLDDMRGKRRQEIKKLLSL